MILPLPLPAHPYIQLRLRLAHHALRQFAASLRSSVEVLLLMAGTVVVGLLTVISLPILYAVSLPWPTALGILGAQALVTALPAWLLRKRLLPENIMAWLRPLPLSTTLRWQADAAVAGMMMAPLAIAYAISGAIWFYQWPAWLRPIAGLGIAAIIAVLVLSWVLTTCILAWRMRAPRPVRRARQPAATSYTPRAPRLRLLFLWRHLFWLPFWRNENVVGVQQSILLAGAGASMLAWLLRLPGLPAPLLGMLASAFLIVLTDRGDKAVREQLTTLRPSLDAWPIASGALTRLACAFSLLPAAGVLLGAGWLLHYLDAAAFHQRVTGVYAIAASAALLAIVGLPRLDPRGRVALVMLSIVALAAIGSELWN